MKKEVAVEKSLKTLYLEILPIIKKRFLEFDALKKSGNQRDFLKELVFCLMTPQSKAKTCIATNDLLFQHSDILDLSTEQIADIIKNVRFRNNKARYIKNAAEKFKDKNIKNTLLNLKNSHKMRLWLVDSIKGLGFKEASHFLRNTGFGYNLAILDRHILKNLFQAGVIADIPKVLSPKLYLSIEKDMEKFAEKIEIPMHHLDFVFWHKQTKEILK